MDTEIELKLFFQPANKDSLIALLNAIPKADIRPTQSLLNTYYDTPNMQLRAWDMGFRVRSSGKGIEQTIKTSGKVAGGIHSRPEYNVDLISSEPNLSLFPQDIWPQECDLDNVQGQLAPLFETNFERLTWHIYIEESLVEVAMDIGTISTDKSSEAICELEFELLAGETSALLELATQLANEVPMRLGQASKAKRGYMLAQQANPSYLAAIDFIELPSGLSLEQTMITLLETGLERWQLLEEMLASNSLSLAEQAQIWYRLRACIRLLKLTLKQYHIDSEELAPWFTELEQALDFIEPALSLAEIVVQGKSLLGKLKQQKDLNAHAQTQLAQLDFNQKLKELWQLPCYGQLQLALVDLMLKANARQLDLSQAKGSNSLLSFANELQEASWQKIITMMPSQANLSSHDYQQFAKALDESILVGFAYGSLYGNHAQEREAFRRPWQDMVLGIRTLACYQKLSQLSSELGMDISDWLEGKSQSLLFAMEHSRRSALTKVPYWR